MKNLKNFSYRIPEGEDENIGGSPPPPVEEDEE